MSVTPDFDARVDDVRYDKVIRVVLCEEMEMAQVLVNDELVYQGNEWDFHSGCNGTELAGEDLGGLWDSGVESFANALKSRFEDRGWSVRVKSQAVSDDEFVF